MPSVRQWYERKGHLYYCGEFNNAGAMMAVDESLMCSFQILKPAEKRQKALAAVLPGLASPPAKKPKI